MGEENQNCPLYASQKNTRPTWLSMDLDILTLHSKQADPQRKAQPWEVQVWSTGTGRGRK